MRKDISVEMQLDMKKSIRKGLWMIQLSVKKLVILHFLMKSTILKYNVSEK